MSVTIVSKVSEYSLVARQMQDGKAYASQEGRIYIGNSISTDFDRIYGFSVCGSYLAWGSDTESLYKEINITVTES